MKFFKHYFFTLILFLSCMAQAQLLPDNTSLNVQSVKRWMNSNRDFANVVQVLEPMHKSDEDLKRFEALPAEEQDSKINAFLQKNNLTSVVQPIVAHHGWKSVGEYMRLSTRLGNAIAAYFFEAKVANLSDDQKKALRAKTDSAVLSAPATDIAFVKTNESLLKAYIQSYSQAR